MRSGFAKAGSCRWGDALPGSVASKATNSHRDQGDDAQGPARSRARRLSDSPLAVDVAAMWCAPVCCAPSCALSQRLTRCDQCVDCAAPRLKRCERLHVKRPQCGYLNVPACLRQSVYACIRGGFLVDGRDIYEPSYAGAWRVHGFAAPGRRSDRRGGHDASWTTAARSSSRGSDRPSNKWVGARH